MEKKLTKEEKFICEITWGCVPVDLAWIRSSKLFLEKKKEFEEGKYKEIFKEQKWHYQ